MPQEDFVKSAEDGNLENVKSVINQGTLKPDGKKAGSALIAAAEAGKLDVCLVLLDWGVPADAVDDQKRRPLHSAVGKSQTEVVEELIQRKANVTDRDGDGATPLALAVKVKSLVSCKLLLSAGAELTGKEALPGLATVVREVQVEQLGAELKKISESTDAEECMIELQEADTMVWKAQREHMRLLELREEQKAGAAIVVLERQIKEESAVFKKSRNSEDSLAYELQNLRVHLQTVETSHGLLMQQLAAAEDQCMQACQEEAQADAEYRAHMRDLTNAQNEKEESERQFAEREKLRDEELAAAKELQSELTALQLRKTVLGGELKTENAQLRGWQRDQEAAAELTAQAQIALSPKKASSMGRKTLEEATAEQAPAK